MITHNNPETENKKVINLPERNAKKDPAGTDPNRYNYYSSSMDTVPENGYTIQPESDSADNKMFDEDRNDK